VALNFAGGDARQLGGERVLTWKLERRQLSGKLFARRRERSFAVCARSRNDIEHDFRQPSRTLAQNCRGLRDHGNACQRTSISEGRDPSPETFSMSSLRPR
jgi:hypothetical protein